MPKGREFYDTLGVYGKEYKAEYEAEYEAVTGNE